MPAMRDSSEDRVGKEEGVVSELTAGSIWSESGRRSGIDGEGEASTETAMVAGGLGLRFGPGLARTSSWRDGGASGRSREAWGAENRAGVARMAVAADGGEARAALLLAALWRRKGGENGHGSGRGIRTAREHG